jgi:low temperature requirement protein LtrA
MLAAVAAGTSPIIPELPIIRAHGAGEQRATFFELFFDLVYVFAVTQLSHHLLAEITWAGAAETAFMLVALYWAWNYTTWMTNWFDPDTVPVRLVLVFVMLASLLMAVAIPQGFGEYALLFACAYSGNDGRLLPVIEEPHVMVAPGELVHLEEAAALTKEVVQREYRGAGRA